MIIREDKRNKFATVILVQNSKVILLHYFDKQYNGAIRREDIEPAESAYESYCAFDPCLY
ncbi:hypothetical protein CN643_01020 [Parageobacillus yumthangensis]|nr:hypothetical protein CN643_01020 [Parageobacillus yumthangensis]PUF87805.1 hypothetical protein DCC82_00970 [Geobacillus sp. LYN3]